MGWGMASVALGAATSGAIFLYAASPHQRLFDQAPSGQALTVAGALSILLALALALQQFGRATAVFYTMTILMLVWTLLPLVVVYVRRTSETATRNDTDG